MHDATASRGGPSEIAALRAEARRDLKAMLLPFVGVASAIVVVADWRVAGALWPVWSTIGTTMVVALGLGVWGTYIRGWRVVRAHRRNPAGLMAGTVSVCADGNRA